MSISTTGQPEHVTRGGKLTIIYSDSAGGALLGDNSFVSPFLTDSGDAPVVQIAAKAYCDDIHNIVGKRPSVTHTPGGDSILIIAGTVGKSIWIKRLVKEKKINIKSIEGKWETFQIAVVSHPFKNVKKALVITGSDQRGTAYGIFELSRKIGVSPFTWWADIPPEKHSCIYVLPGSVIEGPPSVKYRGIFLNDEDWGLRPWAAKNMDTAINDIGPNTYAKVFELLLRLKANYIWPAMHPGTKAFWYYQSNPEVAKKYSIIIGSSHCEPMLRDNVFEWTKNYQKEYGDTSGPWRYDLNRSNIYKYWEDRVKVSKNFETTYTIGMRGIHDGAMPGPDDKDQKVKLLEEIISDQRNLLKKELNQPLSKITQLFCPYKEVLDLYQQGLRLPDDVTIVWSDDNYGYIRQLSNSNEQRRKGGSGVYYHFSYWGSPHDYLWLSSISPALIGYEMNKAYAYGAKKIWIFNVGDIKPAELDIQFAMDLAWDIDKWPAGRGLSYIDRWSSEIFGASPGARIAEVLKEYYHLAASGKPEHINAINYTNVQIKRRLESYHQLSKKANEIAKLITPRLKDAYFELVNYPIQSARLINEKIFYAEKSKQYASTKTNLSSLYYKMALAAFNKIESITRKYNDSIANGKWNSIMSYHPRNQRVFDIPNMPTISHNRKKSDPVSVKPEEHQIDVTKFSTKKEEKKSRFVKIPGLGISVNAMTLLPFSNRTYDSTNYSKAPYLVYTVPVKKGENEIRVKCLPTFPVTPKTPQYLGISVNGSRLQIIHLDNKADSKAWGRNVLTGYAEATLKEKAKNDGKVKIKIYFLCPSIVLNTITVNNNL